jgi:DNA ligase 1
MITRPMLASAIEDINKLNYKDGIIASPKLDGIRALVVDGQLVSRAFKPIPNKHIRSILSIPELTGCDGELMVGNSFHESSSGVMTQSGQPDFTYFIFDFVDSLDKPFFKRLNLAKEMCAKYSNLKLKIVEHREIKSPEELLQYEQECLQLGYEGVMIRSKNSPYKCGRSSVKEGYLLKLKRFEDSEAEILGFEELLHNNNPEERDAFGKIKRSSKQEGMIPANMMGAFKVRDIHNGLEFDVSTGMTEAQRKHYWDKRNELLGSIVKYKHQPSGAKDTVRFPVFLGLRHKDDLG